MTRIPDASRGTSVTRQTYTWNGLTISHGTLSRITGLIQLAFVILNGLIGLRFLLKLMAANPDNAFAQLIYFITIPFLWMFQGITYTPKFGGIEIEFFSLIAIAVYSLIGWIVIQLIWLLFSRLR